MNGGASGTQWAIGYGPQPVIGGPSGIQWVDMVEEATARAHGLWWLV